jgi:hypothetical protein
VEPEAFGGDTSFQPVLAQAKACGYMLVDPDLLIDAKPHRIALEFNANNFFYHPERSEGAQPLKI